jgi:hypothetical protein
MDRLPIAIFGFHLLAPMSSSRPDRSTNQPVRIFATTSSATRAAGNRATLTDCCTQCAVQVSKLTIFLDLHKRDHWRTQTESNRHDQVFEARGCGVTCERGRASMRADRRASQRHQGVRQYRIKAGAPSNNEYPFLSAKIIKNAALNVCPGAPHGMCMMEAEHVTQNLLMFQKS